jgi:hypothetical protein
MLRISNAVRLLLTRLVQSFMGRGLIAGIAALGILGVQAVLERQQLVCQPNASIFPIC